jgi:hypothetical protein
MPCLEILFLSSCMIELFPAKIAPHLLDDHRPRIDDRKRFFTEFAMTEDASRLHHCNLDQDIVQIAESRTTQDPTVLSGGDCCTIQRQSGGRIAPCWWPR